MLSPLSAQLPMVLKVPRLNASPLALCDRPFSLLGFGDILVPGTGAGQGGWVPGAPRVPGRIRAEGPVVETAGQVERRLAGGWQGAACPCCQDAEMRPLRCPRPTPGGAPLSPGPSCGARGQPPVIPGVMQLASRAGSPMVAVCCPVRGALAGWPMLCLRRAARGLLPQVRCAGAVVQGLLRGLHRR